MPLYTLVCSPCPCIISASAIIDHISFVLKHASHPTRQASIQPARTTGKFETMRLSRSCEDISKTIDGNQKQ
jgi:hypothetical protein